MQHTAHVAYCPRAISQGPTRGPHCTHHPGVLCTVSSLDQLAIMIQDRRPWLAQPDVRRMNVDNRVAKLALCAAALSDVDLLLRQASIEDAEHG